MYNFDFSPGIHSGHLHRLALIVLCALLCLLLSSCGEEELDLVPDSDSYESWSKTTEQELDYPIPGHENNYRRIYINDRGLEYTVEEQEGKTRYRFPKGTKILKEIYEGFDPAAGEKPIRITAMIKRPSHEEARGGWLWVIEDGDSGEENIFSGEFCVTCHSNANEQHPYGEGNPQEEFRDYVYFVPPRD